MFVLTDHHTIGNQYVLEMRDAIIQKDRMRFRANMQRLGQILAYEVSRSLSYVERVVTTPLGSRAMTVPAEMPVLVTILRAGIPFFDGFLSVFDGADCGFVGAFRKEDEHEMSIRLEYVASGSIESRILILIDPMLATGRSIVDSVKAVMRNGTPRHLHVASLVAAPEGISFLKEHLSVPYTLWTCAVDDRLNEQFYIVPGLGDAGDLSFGSKL